jgi:hypothetical protein
MRLLFVLFLLTIFGLAYGQKKSSETNLEIKATAYLNAMYKDCDFDKAKKDWYELMINGLKDSYAKKKLTFKSNKAFIDQAKSDATNYCNNHRGFKLLKFIDKKLTTENGNKIALFEYAYTDTAENVTKENKDNIYFFFDKVKLVWQLVDFRFPKIIGDNWDK